MSLEVLLFGMLGWVLVVWLVMSLLIAAKRGDQQMLRRPEPRVRVVTAADMGDDDAGDDRDDDVAHCRRAS